MTSATLWLPSPLSPGERRQWSIEAKGLVELSWQTTAEGGRLKWRRLDLDALELSALGEKELPAAVAGAPLVFADFVVAPLANGILARIERATGQITLGPSWRAPGAEEDATCVGVVVSEEAFVVSDGRRGLMRWHWPQPAAWQKKAAIELDHRALSLAWMAEKKRLALRDAADQIVLLDGERLELDRQWTLGGKVTAGPFVRKAGLACVVENKRLVWLAPEHAEPVWQSVFAAPLIGEPVLLDNRLVLSDQAGKFHALDLATGDPGGLGYTLRANVAAAATPVTLGSGRLFVPLCDGTAVVAPLKKLVRD